MSQRMNKDFDARERREQRHREISGLNDKIKEMGRSGKSVNRICEETGKGANYVKRIIGRFGNM